MKNWLACILALHQPRKGRYSIAQAEGLGHGLTQNAKALKGRNVGRRSAVPPFQGYHRILVSLTQAFGLGYRVSARLGLRNQQFVPDQ